MPAYAENRKARANYEFLETYEAGIELLGLEVKSIRKGGITLDGSYVVVRGGEAYLIGTTVRAYQENNSPENYAPDRNRKLLLTKEEIRKLSSYESKKGLTIVPISVYNKDSKIKVSLAVGRGKREFDKRESIQKREVDREIRRTLK